MQNWNDSIIQCIIKEYRFEVKNIIKFKTNLRKYDIIINDFNEREGKCWLKHEKICI